jgi:glycerol-3-phosphate dehydrogenase
MGNKVSREIAVIGGGINGLCTAHALALDGHRVSVLERGRILEQTSRNSSKLLHGGLRYLETGSFRLVREALSERAWWIRACPQHAHAIRIALPVYANGSRPAALIGAGVALYGLLALGRSLGPSQWLGAREFARLNPHLRAEGLRGGFYFHDGQMDDYALGQWMASQARTEGVQILEQQEVHALDTAGTLRLQSGQRDFDLIVNAAGPWAQLLLERSGLPSPYAIDWVRGSHLLLAEQAPQAYLLPVPGEQRIFFVLPYQGRTLVGTTEVPQSNADPIAPSGAEIDYLLNAYNHYFRDTHTRAAIVDTFSGARPLLHFKGSSTTASREYAIHRDRRLITIYGGKWTTAHALGLRVAHMVRESPPPPR